MATILVVDDTEAIRLGVALVLRYEGHAVRTAADGREALAQITADPPDLVLLDLSMPGMTGLEVLARLPGVPGATRVSVAVYSAMDDAATRRRAARLGAVDFIAKDALGWEPLAKRVRSLVHRFVRPPIVVPGAPRDAQGRLLAR